jgi:hypothetical protein
MKGESTSRANCRAMTLNILFVSIAFPPKLDSEARQVARYFKYLTQSEQRPFQYDVVTSRSPTLYMPDDESLRPLLKGVRQLVEIPLWESRLTNFALHKIAPGVVSTPDPKYSFFLQWKTAARRLQRPDLIYSRSFPMSSALMALKLKEHFKVPWIMHVSDPWADCPTRKDSPTVRQKNQQLERACFEAADVVSLTSVKTIEFYRKKYPNRRYELYPNVYDSSDKRPLEVRPKNGKLRIVHTGALTSIRPPDPFLKAIHSLPQHLQDQIEVVFCGFTERAIRETFQRYACSCFRFLGVLSAEETLELQRSADVLLVIDFVAKGDLGMFFLSKILDYMLARKYVLALTSPGSECQDVIEDKLGNCFDHEDTAGIQNQIEVLVEKHKHQPEWLVRDQIDPRYDAEHNARRLEDLFLSLKPD